MNTKCADCRGAVGRNRGGVRRRAGVLRRPSGAGGVLRRPAAAGAEGAELRAEAGVAGAGGQADVLERIATALERLVNMPVGNQAVPRLQEEQAGASNKIKRVKGRGCCYDKSSKHIPLRSLWRATYR